MRVKKTATVTLAELHTNLFVRKALDQEHAIYLGELISAQVEMRDLIEVTERDGLTEIVDGRHRKEGYELAGVSEIKVKVLEFENETEMIAYAYRKNTGGSKPPTLEDTDHTITLLLKRNESMKSIGEHLGMPASLVRKYAADIKSRMNRVALQAAMTAVTDGGLTITKAAEANEVDVDKLKELLSGKRKKHKDGVGEVQRLLTSTFKSLGLKNAAAIRKLLEKLEDGDVTADQVTEIFKHIDQLQRRHTRSIADWKSRFNAMILSNKETSKLAKSA